MTRGFQCSVVLFISAILSWSSAGAAVFTLTDANARSVIDTGPAAMTDWTVDGINQLNLQGFWFRVGAAGGETSLGALPVGAAGLSDVDFNGSMETLFVRYLGGSFQVEVKYILTGGTPGSGSSDIAEVIKITNTSASPLDFHFFQYCNLHLNGEALNNSVRISGGNTAIQTGGGLIVRESETADVPIPTRYEVGLYPDTLNSLMDGSPTTLGNVAGPVGPGDLTWAFEWDRTIGAGGVLTISKDKWVVPEPATMSLLALGGAAVLGRRRK